MTDELIKEIMRGIIFTIKCESTIKNLRNKNATYKKVAERFKQISEGYKNVTQGGNNRNTK